MAPLLATEAVTAQGERVTLKTSFTQSATLDATYTGGPIFCQGETICGAVGDEVHVVQVTLGQRRGILQGDGSAITAITMSPNGQRIVTASRSLLIRVYDANTLQLLKSFKAHKSPILAMDIDPSSAYIATAGSDSLLAVWDIDRGFQTHSFRGHQGLVSTVHFHPLRDKWELYSGGEDGSVRIWDLVTRKCVAFFKNHVSVVTSLAVTPCGWQLLSASRDKVVSVYHLRDKKLVKTVPVYEGIECIVSFKSDKTENAVVAVGGERGLVRLLDLETEATLLVQQSVPEAAPSALVYLTCTDNQIVAVNSEQHVSYCNKQLELERLWLGNHDEITDLCPLNDDILAMATNGNAVRLVNRRDFSCQLLHGHNAAVLCLAANAQFLVSGSKDHSIRVWQNNSCVSVCIGHTEAVGAIATCHGVDDFFFISGSQDRTVKLWRKEKKRDEFVAKFTIRAHEKDVNAVTISPNNKMFATASQDKSVKLWSVVDGSEMAQLNGHRRGVWAVQFSPTERLIASASGDKTIKLWSLQDFSCLRTLQGHEHSVLRLSFMTRGLQLVSSGADGLVKCWTLQSSECVATLDAHQNKVWAVCALADGDEILSAGADAMMLVWKDTTQKEHEAVVEQHQRETLMEQELSNHVVRRDYRAAVQLALELDKPYRLVTLLDQVMNSLDRDMASITGNAQVDALLGELSADRLERLLTYVRDWNTNARRVVVAQAVLHVILTRCKVSDLLALPRIKELLHGILPYTERQCERSRDLVTKSFIVDYTLRAMDSLLEA